MSLNPDQIELLNELRKGSENMSMLVVNRRISKKSFEAFQEFKYFLRRQGNWHPDQYDLSLSIDRLVLLATLNYANDRNCLGIQYCFALDKPIKHGGRIRLVTIGAMTDHCKLSDHDIYHANFETHDADGKLHPQHFIDLDHRKLISKGTANNLTGEFQHIYKDQYGKPDGFRAGSILPVKALLKIFSDPTTILGTAETLTIRWGLLHDNPRNVIGNLRIVIGIGDLQEGPVIERNDEDKFTDPPGDCPPRTPC